MPTPIERAIAHLNKLEADRSAAIAVIKEKVQEAKLIKARQEGFQEALEILKLNLSVRDEATTPSHVRSEKRTRRNIPQFISNELSFSGKAMTTNQIAKAIDYLPDRTEKALERMESSGQIMRNREGRLAVPPGKLNGHSIVTVASEAGGARGEVSVQE
jgi:hypothetical protein